MSPMLVLFATAVTPLAGLGLVQLQARLERWDYERHAEDGRATLTPCGAEALNEKPARKESERSLT